LLPPLLGLFPGGAEAFWAIISRKLSKLRMVISFRPAGMAIPASAKASRMPTARSVRIAPFLVMSPMNA